MSRLLGIPWTSATVFRGRSRFGFLLTLNAALAPAASAEPTTAAAAAASKLPFLALPAVALAGTGAGEALARCGFRAAALDLPVRAGAAERFAGFLPDFFADFDDEDFRAVLRAAGLDAPFFLACVFAFFAVRAGFFRAMTNPFGFLDSLR